MVTFLIVAIKVRVSEYYLFQAAVISHSTVDRSCLSTNNRSVFNSKCWKLVFRAFHFMGMFDWEGGLIPVARWDKNSIKSFKLKTLYTCVSSYYYRSMTIIKTPIDHICAIIRIRPLITDTQTITVNWKWLKWFSRESANKRTDATKCIISLASRSINISWECMTHHIGNGVFRNLAS